MSYYNTVQTALSREFLNGKVNRAAEHLMRTRNYDSIAEGKSRIIQPTQVYETESGYIRGILWNMLGEFVGHYEFIVNPETFDYSVKQHSCYGSLTYTTPAKDSTVYTKENMTPEQIAVIEGCISETLLLCTQHSDEDSFRILNVVSRRIQKLTFSEVMSDTF